MPVNVINRALLAATASISFFAAAAADARHAVRRGGYDGGIVTTYSRHGNGEISGAVRPGRHAWEVQLPGGTWVSCRRSCEETLRVETIDIFENDGRMVGYGTFQNQCGVLGCLELHYPR